MRYLLAQLVTGVLDRPELDPTIAGVARPSCSLTMLEDGLAAEGRGVDG